MKTIALTFALLALLRGPLYGQNTNWTYAAAADILSSPAIGSDGTIYFGAYDEYFYAVRPDGTLRWRTSVASGRGGEAVYIFSSPALGSDGTIYFGTEHQKQNGQSALGTLYALNPTNGTPKWSITLTNAPWSAIYSDPAIGADGTIYIGCYDTNLYAVNPNGSIQWSARLGDQIYSDVVVGTNGTLYVGCDNGKLYAFLPNGTNLWSFQGGLGFTGSPALGHDGTIYFGSTRSNGHRLFAVNPNGSKRWEYLTAGNIESSPAIGVDGTLYFGSNDKKVYALNPDGSLKWTFLTGGSVRSSPAIGEDGRVYVGSDDGNLYAFDSRGTNLWSGPLGGMVYSSPSLAPTGALYVGSTDGKLYSFTGAGDLARTPWAMFRRNPRHTAQFFAPATIGFSFTVAGGFQLELTGVAGQNYCVHASTDLLSWQPWTNFVSPVAHISLIDPITPPPSKRFYRVGTR